MNASRNGRVAMLRIVVGIAICLRATAPLLAQLSGPTWAEYGGSVEPGGVLVQPGRATMLEGDSFLVSLQQLNPTTSVLEFALLLEPGFDQGDRFIPDALEVTYWDYGGGDLAGVAGLPSQGWAYGAKKPGDHKGWFIGWSLGITGFSVGGASSIPPGVIATYEGPTLTAPVSPGFSIGGSTTYYSLVD